MTGRGLMLGMCRDEGRDPQSLFTGGGTRQPRFPQRN